MNANNCSINQGCTISVKGRAINRIRTKMTGHTGGLCQGVPGQTPDTEDFVLIAV